MKTLKIIYQLLMIVFSPITFGLVLPISFMVVLNKIVYGVYPSSTDFNEYSNWVCNQGTLILLIIGYIISWFLVKRYGEKRGVEII